MDQMGSFTCLLPYGSRGLDGLLASSFTDKRAAISHEGEVKTHEPPAILPEDGVWKAGSSGGDFAFQARPRLISKLHNHHRLFRVGWVQEDSFYVQLRIGKGIMIHRQKLLQLL